MLTEYYYDHMTGEEKAAYRQILIGLTALSPSISVPALPGRQLFDAAYYLRLDHPEIFYAPSFKCRMYEGASHAELIPEYLFPADKIREHQKALNTRVQRLAAGAPKGTEEEKELYIHDTICRLVHYDKLKKPYSHEILGPLGQGVGVCEGIAKSVKILCDALGLWCMIPISEAAPDKGIRYRHTWNILRIGGKTYHMDATFDLGLSSESLIRHDYFNLNDARCFRDHEPVIRPVPACGDGDHFYYRQQKLSLTKQEEAVKRISRAAAKGKPFLFHWRGGYLTRAVLTDLLAAAADEARAHGRYARLSLNWPQAVLYLTFEKEAVKEEIALENADAQENEENLSFRECPEMLS